MEKKGLSGQKDFRASPGWARVKGLGARWEKGLFFPFGRKAIFQGAKVHGSIKSRQPIRNRGNFLPKGTVKSVPVAELTGPPE